MQSIAEGINVMATETERQIKTARQTTEKEKEKEKQWVIDEINSVPKERDEKTGKWYRSRKKVQTMYQKCWEQLQQMQYPPNFGHWSELKKIVSRDTGNQKQKRQG